MKKKQLVVMTLVLTLILVMSIFVGCNSGNNNSSKNSSLDSGASEMSSLENSDSSESTEKELTSEQKNLVKGEKGIDSDAKVEFGKDEQGNTTYTYQNPDGTGGGGVAY